MILEAEVDFNTLTTCGSVARAPIRTVGLIITPFRCFCHRINLPSSRRANQKNNSVQGNFRPINLGAQRKIENRLRETSALQFLLDNDGIPKSGEIDVWQVAAVQNSQGIHPSRSRPGAIIFWAFNFMFYPRFSSASVKQINQSQNFFIYSKIFVLNPTRRSSSRSAQSEPSSHNFFSLLPALEIFIPSAAATSFVVVLGTEKTKSNISRTPSLGAGPINWCFSPSHIVNG